MFDDRELSALDRRAHDTFAAHMDTFTASNVLHDIFMEIVDDDQPGARVIVRVLALLDSHRERTSAEWQQAQDKWLYALRVASESDLYLHDGNEDEL